MAVARLARLASAASVGPDTRVLDLVLDSERLGFVGGQYIIVDSGLVLPGGKAAKRAYSILGNDGVQDRFQLASKRIPAGLVSGFLHLAQPATEIKFSGPWGKFFPAEDAAGPTLVLATDTGITAALGLLRSARFAALLAETTFFWLRAGPHYFLPDPLVRGQLPRSLRAATIGDLPPIDHPERVPWVRSLVRGLLRSGPLAQAFIAGDGAVNYALLDDLVAAGVRATRDSVESFFNMPKKSG
jgi:ferredoxin-NADP reductase